MNIMHPAQPPLTRTPSRSPWPYRLGLAIGATLLTVWAWASFAITESDVDEADTLIYEIKNLNKAIDDMQAAPEADRVSVTVDGKGMKEAWLSLPRATLVPVFQKRIEEDENRLKVLGVTKDKP